MTYEVIAGVQLGLIAALAYMVWDLAGRLRSERSLSQIRQDSLDHYERELPKLAAEVQKLEDAWTTCKWQAIETAPKDDTTIDLLANGRRYADCKWNDTGWVQVIWTDYSWGYYRLKCEPTHWMPIPPPTEGK